MTLPGRSALLLLAGAAVVLTSARCQPAVPPPEQRIADCRDNGYRYVLPPHWKLFPDEEARSLHGSLFSAKVSDLTGAKRDFVAGLPDTALGQVEGWSKYYFLVVGPPETRRALIGGLPALEVEYRVKTRESDPETRALYWIVHREPLLFFFRATFPPGRFEPDAPAARELVQSIEFTAPQGEVPPGLNLR